MRDAGSAGPATTMRTGTSRNAPPAPTQARPEPDGRRRRRAGPCGRLNSTGRRRSAGSSGCRRRRRAAAASAASGHQAEDRRGAADRRRSGRRCAPASERARHAPRPPATASIGLDRPRDADGRSTRRHRGDEDLDHGDAGDRLDVELARRPAAAARREQRDHARWRRPRPPGPRRRRRRSQEAPARTEGQRSRPSAALDATAAASAGSSSTPRGPRTSRRGSSSCTRLHAR